MPGYLEGLEEEMSVLGLKPRLLLITAPRLTAGTCVPSPLEEPVGRTGQSSERGTLPLHGEGPLEPTCAHGATCLRRIP